MQGTRPMDTGHVTMPQQPQQPHYDWSWGAPGQPEQQAEQWQGQWWPEAEATQEGEVSALGKGK